MGKKEKKYQIILSLNLINAYIYLGTSLRELVYKFKSKTLMLLKLLLLEKRVSFFLIRVKKKRERKKGGNVNRKRDVCF